MFLFITKSITLQISPFYQHINQRKHYKIKFQIHKVKFSQYQYQNINLEKMQSLHHNLYDHSHSNSEHNPRNKATVKKQLSHRLIRFNQTNGKQNKYHHSNLILRMNLAGKQTVRKNAQVNDEKIHEKEPQFCANHSQRGAQFMVRIEDQILTYCKKCATHIASQGFDVHRIVTSPIHNLTRQLGSSHSSTVNISTQILLPSISPSRKRSSLPNTNTRIQLQKQYQLTQLTNSLKQLKFQYTEKSRQLRQICHTFQSQKETLNHYYAQLISYIEEIRDSHIQAIDESKINAIQVCEIENGQIDQTVEEIEEMVSDIQQNMQKILNEVDEQSYAQCYDFYKQKQGIFSHRLQELGIEAKPWPCTSEEQINNKVRSFKSIVNELHEVHDDQIQEQNQGDPYMY